MPSGEVFTSPIEDSVNGHIHFSFPGIHGGRAIEGVTLWVKDGYIERWDAENGKDYLDKIFEIPGTRRFGEAAIGTNYKIQKITKNILFDEKIGVLYTWLSGNRTCSVAAKMNLRCIGI